MRNYGIHENNNNKIDKPDLSEGVCNLALMSAASSEVPAKEINTNSK